MFLVFGGRVCYTELQKIRKEAIGMRCSCKVCGTYMVQREQGVQSGCVCPECFYTCSACISPEGGQPLSADQLRSVLMSRQFLDREEEGYSDPFHSPMRPEEYED